jgi:polygalacturonase
MDLHLEAGATIKASEKFADYGIPDPNEPLPTSSASSETGEKGNDEKPKGGDPNVGRDKIPALITGSKLTDVAITGAGTIDGSGAMFWIWSDKAARRYPPGRRFVPRPVLVSLTGIERLHVDGITLTNSPSFHLVPRNSKDVTIENIRIVAPSDAPNTDAINIGGERVVIRKCEIDSGDDNVAIQSGSHDVLVEDLTCLHGHGISIGSPTDKGLSHVIVRRCSFNGTDNGLRIKSYRGRGGEVHDISYTDITMKNVRRPFDINMRYNGNANTPTDVGPREAEPGQTKAIPNFHDIRVTNLTVTRSPLAGRILGIPEQMPYNIKFTNAKFQTHRGFLVQDAKQVTFENTEIEAANGPSVVIENATVDWNGTTKTASEGGSPASFY